MCVTTRVTTIAENISSFKINIQQCLNGKHDVRVKIHSNMKNIFESNKKTYYTPLHDVNDKKIVD